MVRHEEKIGEITLHPETGLVEAIMLADGRRIEGILAGMQKVIAQAATAMPTHRETIRRKFAR